MEYNISHTENNDFIINVQTTLYNDLETIKNPWTSQSRIKYMFENNIIHNIIDCSVFDLTKMFKKLFILNLSSEIEIDPAFYDMFISKDNYTYIKNNLCIKEIPFASLKDGILKKFLTIVKYEDLPINYNGINGKTMRLDDSMNDILCINLMHISEQGVNSFLKQYNGISNLSSIIQMFLVNNYIQKDIYGEKNKLLRYQMISNMDESNYWSYYFNCKLNITSKFMSRGFNLSLTQRLENPEVRKVIESMSTKLEEESDYLSFIFRQNTYVDASTNIKKDGYQIYRINKTDPNENLTKQEFNNILDSCLNKKELYMMLTNILITKDYCHLVINNDYALKKLSDKNLFNETKPDNEKRSLMQKYTPLFAYLWSYAILTMYIEESIKRSRTVESDRFVFDLDTASILPYFPSVGSNPELSPYLPMLIAKEILNAKNNNLGVQMYCNVERNFIPGVVSQNEFDRRLNLFVTGTENTNYFENVDWNNLAVSGSIISAVTPKFNPLMLHFASNDMNIDLNGFFNEYYADADIDIMCNCSKFDYINKVHQFADQIDVNIRKFNNVNNDEKYVTRLIPVKSVALMVNKEFITKYILPTTKMSYLDIITKLHDVEIKQLFHPFYVKHKILDNMNYSNSSEFSDPKYDSYFELCKPEDILIVIINHEKNQDKKLEPKVKHTIKSSFVDNINSNTVLLESIEQDGNIPEIDMDYEDQIDQDISDINQSELYNDISADECVFIANENLKFKLVSKYLKHNFELFRIKYESFFSTVARFHLPCVRGYYNGSKTYLLPSCVIACNTLTNIDYKYFAGSKDPIEVINKYRMRGFGTYLNDKEKIRMIQYSNGVTKWKKLYHINIKNTNSVESVLGSLKIDNNLFKPSSVLNNKNTVYYKPTNEWTKHEVNEHNIMSIYEKLFQGNFNFVEHNNSIQSQIFKKTCINDMGYINTFKKWLIEACYEQPIKPIQI